MCSNAPCRPAPPTHSSTPTHLTPHTHRQLAELQADLAGLRQRILSSANIEDVEQPGACLPWGEEGRRPGQGLRLGLGGCCRLLYCVGNEADRCLLGLGEGFEGVGHGAVGGAPMLIPQQDQRQQLHDVPANASE
jgi:hypothetical protein